ncbi:unnamed protein product [Cercopithifilaria johnstoni]|uniref:C3H1-type domain-containing protein n=1 Tax=Cercopithifilaria johnstoni TaxID=2874296 RepID=A0A8J2M9J4_9BILA|nr:unnamed protein product [Cercopithifilaria johnstoni]
MAAMVHSKNVGHDSLVLQCDSMAPVPVEFREFLYRVYGIEPHVMAYFNQQEPNRIYVVAQGKLNCVDISAINQKSSKTIERREFALPGDNRSGICPRKFTWQMLTDVEREELKKERRKKSAYKTSLCRTFRKTGKCENGEACVFAHGEEELRIPPKAHPKYKTQLCNNFIKWKYCPYGARCQFIHGYFDESVDLVNHSMSQHAVESVISSHQKLENVDMCFGNTINNQSTENIVCDGQSLSNAGPIASSSILGRLNSVDNDSVLEWLSERLNNVLV